MSNKPVFPLPFVEAMHETGTAAGVDKATLDTWRAHVAVGNQGEACSLLIEITHGIAGGGFFFAPQNAY